MFLYINREVEEEVSEDEESEKDADVETSSCGDSARSTPIPGSQPSSKRASKEGMPKKRYQKAGLFSDTYKETE